MLLKNRLQTQYNKYLTLKYFTFCLLIYCAKCTKMHLNEYFKKLCLLHQLNIIDTFFIYMVEYDNIGDFLIIFLKYKNYKKFYK